MAVLMISHDLNLVKRFADSVCVMQEGNIVEKGKVASLFSDPQHPYTVQLLNSEPERVIPENETEALRHNKELLSGHQLKCHFSTSKGFFRRTTNTVKAVDNIDLLIREGETLGIVGESGSGKSTLGRCLLKLENCSGKIVFNQQQIDQLNHTALRP